MSIYPVFPTNGTGIFIWWPKIEYVEIVEFLIQFWHKNKLNPTVFSDEIIGTTALIHEHQGWDEIQEHFVKFPARTNIYERTSPLNDQMLKQRRRRNLFETADDDDDDENIAEESDGDEKQHSGTVSILQSKSHNKKKLLEEEQTQNEVITEVRVNGNVTGILIPNTTRVMVRVIAKDRDGELNQDTRYLEWKTVKKIYKDLSYFFGFIVELHFYALNYLHFISD